MTPTRDPQSTRRRLAGVPLRLAAQRNHAVRVFAFSLVVGCFSEPDTPTATAAADAETTTNGSSSGVTSASSTTTSSAENGEAGSSSTSGEHGTTSGGTLGTGDGSDDGCATPAEIPVGGPFDVGEMQTIPLDFDDFPGAPGAPAELCIMFTTDNPASARTVSIGDQLLAFGPCGGAEPSWSQCVEYLKPAGVVDVTIDNTTFGPGCQDGQMDDLILRFGCANDGGSTDG